MRKNDWLAMDLKDQLGQFHKNIEFSGIDGFQVPPGKVLTVKQLVLYYDVYSVFSSTVRSELTTCETAVAKHK
jgi:hypothetical protein